MITVLVSDGSHYEFRSPKEAGYWIERHPDLYDHDTNNILVVSDRKLDVPVIEIIKKTIVIDCSGCNAQLHTETHSHEKFVVECPACGIRNFVE